ncbi:MAG: hypothetical protein AB7S26_12470 [Sandaracinaceae bacterium]
MSRSAILPLLTLASACASAPGTASIFLEAEDTITSGVPAGSTGEAIQDGWSVTFDEYAVAIGDVRVRDALDPDVRREASERFAVDLRSVPETGVSLWTFDDLDPGRWEIGYAIGGITLVRRDPVSDAAFAALGPDAAYFIRGTLTRADGRSCPPSTLATPGAATPSGDPNAGGDPCYDNPSITFELALPSAISFGPCEVDGLGGFAVTSSAETSVAITIHGDHLFFNGFPEGSEGGVMRFAQWLADCDLDLDGEVTRAELEAINPSDLPEIDSRFQLGGTPLTPLDSMWTYLTAQGMTQGHFQGEGECALRSF